MDSAGDIAYILPADQLAGRLGQSGRPHARGSSHDDAHSFHRPESPVWIPGCRASAHRVGSFDPAASACPGGPERDRQSRDLPGASVSVPGPRSRRSSDRRRRRATPAVHVLHGRLGWRRVEDDRQRPDVAQRVGRIHRHGLDRRHRRVRFQPGRGLRGHRQRPDSQQRDPRKRRLPVERCRKDLGVCRAEGCRADRRAQGAPAGPGHGLRCRARTALRTEPRTRRLSHHGRRQDVAEGPVHQRADGRGLARDEPGEPERDLRGRVARRTAAVDDHQRRSGQRRRRLQDVGRRRNLVAPHHRTSPDADRKSRRRSRPVESEARLRHPRSARHRSRRLHGRTMRAPRGSR